MPAAPPVHPCTCRGSPSLATASLTGILPSGSRRPLRGPLSPHWLGLGFPAYGESGIRTHGAASGSTVFETARFDRSRISPSTPGTSTRAGFFPLPGGFSRAQEDSNLRPLDPQSNALSRLSYGHLCAVVPRLSSGSLHGASLPWLAQDFLVCAAPSSLYPARLAIHGWRARSRASLTSLALDFLVYGEGGIRTPGTL